MSYLNIPIQNILFGELINYLDIFDEFSKVSKSGRLLSDYFKVENIYLGFTEYLKDFGANNDHEYFVQSNTGRSKINSEEYLRYLKLFNPTYAVLPFEYLHEDVGKKRLLRCYKKLKELFSKITKEKDDLKNQNFIIPYFIKFHKDIPMNEFKQYLPLSKGILVFTEQNKALTPQKVLEYKEVLKSIDIDMKIKANSYDFFDIFISVDLGCSHVEVSFPFTFCRKGQAMNIDFDSYDESKSYGSIDEIERYDYNLNTLNMNDLKYESDIEILVKNCKCFVCQTGYKRAYIHHLYKCKELNGNILLALHNTFQAKKLYEDYKSITEQEKRNNYLLWIIKTFCVKK